MALYNTTTKADFDEKVLKSKKPVLVDFWAAWCAPCIAMAPILHKISDNSDDFDIVKVNVEESTENSQLAVDYGVVSIPNMNIFKAGKVVDNIVGMVGQPFLEKKLQEFTDK